MILHTRKDKIIKGNKPVHLHGVNLGGWLMMEAYILHAPNLPVKDLKRQFKEKLGSRAVSEFERFFRDNFIRESDIKNIAKLGFNCIRVPFQYNLIETKPGHYDKNGFRYLDNVIHWAKKADVWVILDLHGAVGSQNHDWHSDSYGEALLWKNKKFQKRTFELWEVVADRYKNEPTVAGYDLLNEAVLSDTRLLNEFYKNIIKSIRCVDKNHILFIEGIKWAQDIECLDIFNDDNYCLSVHYYEPALYTFNLVPFLKYPLKGKHGPWNKKTTQKILLHHQKIADRHQVPVFVGEFGIHYRNGVFNEQQWLKECLEQFNELGFHWTYWTYKAIKNSFFPDGIYSYYPNAAWVNRPGPLTGWNTYANLWPTHKNEIIKGWQTKEFTGNKHIVDLLRKYA